MLHLVRTERVYPPDTVAAMAIAFDEASASIPPSDFTEVARRRLAVLILRHVDSGVREPARLAELVLGEFVAAAGEHEGEVATG